MESYNQIRPQVEKLARESSEKQYLFFQHILLVSASIFGIVVSLHSYSASPLYIRLVFALSMVLFALGILTTGIVLYNQTYLAERMQKAFGDECKIAVTENRNWKGVAVHKLKIHIFCEKATYILLLAALFFLCLYSLLLSFSS